MRTALTFAAAAAAALTFTAGGTVSAAPVTDSGPGWTVTIDDATGDVTATISECPAGMVAVIDVEAPVWSAGQTGQTPQTLSGTAPQGGTVEVTMFCAIPGFPQSSLPGPAPIEGQVIRTVQVDITPVCVVDVIPQTPIGPVSTVLAAALADGDHYGIAVNGSGYAPGPWQATIWPSTDQITVTGDSGHGAGPYTVTVEPADVCDAGSVTVPWTGPHYTRVNLPDGTTQTVLTGATITVVCPEGVTEQTVPWTSAVGVAGKDGPLLEWTPECAPAPTTTTPELPTDPTDPTDPDLPATGSSDTGVAIAATVCAAAGALLLGLARRRRTIVA